MRIKFFSSREVKYWNADRIRNCSQSREVTPHFGDDSSEAAEIEMGKAKKKTWGLRMTRIKNATKLCHLSGH
jgi:hypothetical protein